MSCEYCDNTIALLVKNRHYWAHIVKDGRGSFLSIRGAANCNGIDKKIRYCPMCGEKLGGDAS